MEFASKFLSETDKEKISLAVQLHTPIEIFSYTLPREKEVYIQEVLKYFLLKCHQEHMFDNLSFCLGELLTNSKKANTKRVYFLEQKLDINDEMGKNKHFRPFEVPAKDWVERFADAYYEVIEGNHDRTDDQTRD